MDKFEEVTVIILAGGLGTRLRSVIDDRPKVLAEVRGQPFAAYLLQQVAAAGLHRVIFCTGYLGEQVRRTFGNSHAGLRLVYSQEAQALGTGGALRLALQHLKTDLALVMNGDSFCEADLAAFKQWHTSHLAQSSLLLTWMENTERYGRVQVEANGCITGFIEKKSAGGPGWINAGIYLIHRDRIASLPAGQAISLERDIFPLWTTKGLWGYPVQGRFLDIGTPESYLQAATELPRI